MKILVDENIPNPTVQALISQGHDVIDVRGTSNEGVPDDVLWERCLLEQRLLITTDKGFARHRFEGHFGILVIRLRQPNRERIHHRVTDAMARFAPEEWPGLLVTMRDAVQSHWRNPPDDED